VRPSPVSVNFPFTKFCRSMPVLSVLASDCTTAECHELRRPGRS
jgi:hypothetical protein